MQDRFDVWRWIDAAWGLASLACSYWQWSHGSSQGWIVFNAGWGGLMLVSAWMQWTSRLLVWLRRHGRAFVLAGLLR